jgi:hypothetical protein
MNSVEVVAFSVMWLNEACLYQRCSTFFFLLGASTIKFQTRCWSSTSGPHHHLIKD